MILRSHPLRTFLVLIVGACTVNCALAGSCYPRQSIGIGANGRLWVLGTYQLGPKGSFQPFVWDGQNWVKGDRGFAEIAVLPSGDIIGINSQAELWQHTHNAWTRLASAATRVAVGANGQLWMLGTNHVGPNDYQPYFWDGKKWVGIDGALADLAVLPNGSPIGINSTGQIWQRINNAWVSMPDVATRIAVGKNGKIWILGRNQVDSAGNYQPYFWDGKKWVGIDGGLIEIAVSPDGSLLGVNRMGQIWQRSNNSWNRLPGTAAIGC